MTKIRIISVALAAALAFGVAGCRKEGTSAETEKWTQVDEALALTRPGDMLLLQGGNVCRVESFPNDGPMMHIHCQDGTSKQEYRHHVAEDVSEIIHPDDPRHDVLAQKIPSVH